MRQRTTCPAILAATLISKEPEKYGFIFEPDPLIVYDSIEVEGAADLRVLAECAGTDYDDDARAQPGPAPSADAADMRRPAFAFRTVPAAARWRHSPTIPQEDRVLYARHKVTRGDTLYELAQAYRRQRSARSSRPTDWDAARSFVRARSS